MDWLILAGAAAEAVSQVLVVVACGVILCRTGYLSQSAQKSISQVNLYFMTPCLLFTKIASTINWDQFKAFWPIPVFFLLFSSVSWVVSRVGSRFLRFSSDEEKFVTASILFSNTNSLPMALVQSLALSAAGSRLLRDENDTKEQVAARGISYILFYAIFGNLVRWSYGFSLLVPKDDPKDDEELEQSLHRQAALESVEEQQAHSSGAGEVLINVDAPQSSSSRHSAAMSSASSIRTLNDPQIFDRDDTSEDEGDEEPGTHRPNHYQSAFFKTMHHTNKSKKSHLHSTHMQPLSPHRKSTRTVLKQKATTALERIRQVLTPPLLTAIIALVIGLVPALHQLFMSPDSKLYAFIIHPIENCGAAAIPMILLCLGAQVVNFATSSSSSLGSSGADGPVKPGPPVRRRSANSPSVFPHARPVGSSSSSSSSTSSSEDEDNSGQDPGWLRVQSPPHRNTYGQGGIASHRAHASSTTTLYNLDDSSNNDEDEMPSFSVENGSSELGLSLRAHRFKWLTPVGFVLFSRMFLVPLICLPAILFHPETLSPVLTMDPTFSLTLVLICAAPTAINMIQLCQIKGFFEQDMAAVLFWSYCVLGVPCVLGWALVGLWAAGR